MQRTLVIIKPDAIFNLWDREIKARYEENGLRIVKECGYALTRMQSAEFYREHEGKPFFAGLVLAMASGPCAILVLEGEDAIARVRMLNGVTDPRKADPGTIRRDFQSAGGPFNTVHASDSPASAEREISLVESWFSGKSA